MPEKTSLGDYPTHGEILLFTKRNKYHKGKGGTEGKEQKIKERIRGRQMRLAPAVNCPRGSRRDGIHPR